METALQKLAKILELERTGGYTNRAVIGGIQRYIPIWIDGARTEAVAETEKALVEQIGQLMTDYGQLPGPAARAKLVDAIRERLEKAIATRLATPPPAIPADTTIRKIEPVNEKKEERVKVAQPRKPSIPESVPPEKPPPGLEAPVTHIRGIGPSMGEKLGRLGIYSILDLLTYYPRRHIDYSALKPINRLEYGEQVTIIGTVREANSRKIKGNRRVLRCVISDGTGYMQCVWFNQTWMLKKLTAGTTFVVSGKIDQYLGRFVMNSPELEPLDKEQLHTNRLVPIYSLTVGITSKSIRSYVKRAQDRWVNKLPDHLPREIRQRVGVMNLDTAITKIHFPDNWEQLAAAQQRISFDELFFLQLGLFEQRRQWKSQPGIPIRISSDWLHSFIQQLPFQLTGAQQKVMADILEDISSAVPMNRLLQGDVGSGKTVVAVTAMAAAVHAGHQTALMAPTEILAEQHAASLARLLPEANVRLLTGSLPAAEKRALYKDISSGSVQIVIGTQALIQDKLGFQNLALVVVDEQHRFGVEQRATLRQKGHNPHVLVMTATPIPRTLALTIHGDLDLSIINEMPPGRQEITTRWLETRSRERAYTYIRSQVNEGRQAFIICPLVEETETSEDKAATAEYKRLQEKIFPDLKLGLLHGRMKPQEKEKTMQSFYRGETNILISTSVVEVGIDVPNATVMLVEGANRFGLSQLHQFRGRVGRGAGKSACLLMADATTPEAKERLTALEATNDGFKLAEKDLELRGPGEFFGTRQSGLPDLKMATLTDIGTLEKAREESSNLFDTDPLFEKPEHRLLAYQLEQFWSQRTDMS